MRSQEFHLELERGNILPLYYFYGPERNMIGEALSRIEEKILSPATREFNREIVDAEETGIQPILDKIHTLPLGASRRLVVIRQADGFWKKPSAALLSYFEAPTPSACAVFVGEKADLRTKFFTTLEKKGATVTFYPPSTQEIVRWLRAQGQQAGNPLSEEGAFLLLEMVGPNLQDLKAEIQKVCSSLPRGQKMESADIEKLTENTSLVSPFDLPKAVGRLDLKKALGLLRKALEQGEAPTLLLALVLRHLRMVRKAQEWRRKGISPRDIESRLRVHPREAAGFWEQVRIVPPLFWAEAWKISLETDRALKSSRGDKEMLLEEYLWNLNRLGRQKRPGRVGMGSDPIPAETRREKI
jgi:DNA polymerase III subunit delta